MKMIWEFWNITPKHIDEREFLDNCHILNARMLVKAGYPSWKTFNKKEFPVAQLALTMDGFDADVLYFEGRYFVSEKLRSAMQLDKSGVMYFDVDASRSTAPVRSKNFKIMEVTAIENASDPANSRYKMMKRGNNLPPAPSIYSVKMRPDATPAHELFNDHFFRGLYCTDDLAVRVLKAGCIGVQFADPEQGVKFPMRFRTLRGIEEEAEWDPVSCIETMKLVHPIH